MLKKLLILVVIYCAFLSFNSNAQTKKPVINEIYIFSADWCSYCVELKENILTNKDVKKELNKYNNVIYIDYDKYRLTSRAWGVKSIPHIVAVNKINPRSATILDVWKPQSRLQEKNRKSFVKFLKKYSPKP